MATLASRPTKNGSVPLPQQVVLDLLAKGPMSVYQIERESELTVAEARTACGELAESKRIYQRQGARGADWCLRMPAPASPVVPDSQAEAAPIFKPADNPLFVYAEMLQAAGAVVAMLKRLTHDPDGYKGNLRMIANATGEIQKSALGLIGESVSGA